MVPLLNVQFLKYVLSANQPALRTFLPILEARWLRMPIQGQVVMASDGFGLHEPNSLKKKWHCPHFHPTRLLWICIRDCNHGVNWIDDPRGCSRQTWTRLTMASIITSARPVPMQLCNCTHGMPSSPMGRARQRRWLLLLSQQYEQQGGAQ